MHPVSPIIGKRCFPAFAISCAVFMTMMVVVGIPAPSARAALVGPVEGAGPGTLDKPGPPIDGDTVTLTWSEIYVNNGPPEYEVIVSDLATGWYAKHIEHLSGTTRSQQLKLPPGKYSWGVRACTAIGCMGGGPLGDNWLYFQMVGPYATPYGISDRMRLIRLSPITLATSPASRQSPRITRW